MGYWLSNFGEGISVLTEGILLANYAPTSDCRQQNEQYKPVTTEELTTASGEEKYFGCRIPRTNPCMAKFIKVSIMCMNFYMITKRSLTFLCISASY